MFSIKLDPEIIISETLFAKKAPPYNSTEFYVKLEFISEIIFPNSACIDPPVS